MRINFGYAAISMALREVSPNKTVTVKTLEKIDRNLWNNKVELISKQNINNTIKILRYNNAYGIKLYRLTSKLIPLATYSGLSDWNWKNILREEFRNLGSCIKETGERVSTHPDHFTLLNSPREEVLKASLKDLDYHCSMFELMNLDSRYKIVLHIGGIYKNKNDSVKRFYEGFGSLENRIKSRIVLENDDKLFNAREVLEICQNIGVPMVLDIHHDKCNPSPYTVQDMINDIFQTWRGEEFPPKMHLSSPKSEKEFRSHHDFINSSDFLEFVGKIKSLVHDFDVMIEAKMKDGAVFKLMGELDGVQGIRKTDGASIDIPDDF